jgi:putative membrane protein
MITMMSWNGGGWPWWQAGLMWIGVIAFLGVLVWAGYALIAAAARKPAATEGRSRDARRILDERLARGEIDTTEYQRLRDLIAPGSQSPAGSGSGR